MLKMKQTRENDGLLERNREELCVQILKYHYIIWNSANLSSNKMIQNYFHIIFWYLSYYTCEK